MADYLVHLLNRLPGQDAGCLEVEGGSAGTREPPFIEGLAGPLRKEQEKAHIARGGQCHYL